MPCALARLTAGIRHYLLRPPSADDLIFPAASLLVKVPHATPFSPAGAQQLMATLLGLRQPLALEIHSRGGQMMFGVVVPWSAAGSARSAILAAVPHAVVAVTQPETTSVFPFMAAVGSATRQPWAPLAGLSSARAVDVLNPLLQALADLHPNEQCVMQILARPASHDWSSVIRRASSRRTLSPLNILSWGRWPQALLGLALAERTPRYVGDLQHLCDEKTLGPFVEATITVGIRSAANRCGAICRSLVMALAGFATPLNGLTILPPDLAGTHLRAALGQFRFSLARGDGREPRLLVLTPAELAALWHLPSEATSAEGVQWASAASLMAPAQAVAVPQVPYIILGLALRPEGRRPVVMCEADRSAPLLVVGKTGVGKSTFLENHIVQDLAAGRGVAVADTHGDMTPRLLGHLPPGRIAQTVVIDTSRPDCPVGLNPLALAGQVDQNILVGELIGVFKLYFGDLWSGGRMEDTMRQSLFALTGRPGHSLADLTRLFYDPVFRQELAMATTNPVVRDYWLHEFASLSMAQQQERSAPLLNKVRGFLTNDTLRAMLTAPTCLDLRQHMDQGGVLFVRPAGLPETERILLSAMVSALLFAAARSRVDTPAASRRPCYLYVDEAQTLTSSALPSILAQGRKFGLICAGVALQYLEALEPATRQALLGNAGTYVVFRCGPDDARLLRAALAPLEATDLENLNRYQAVCKMQRGGITLPPFGLEPPEPLPAGDPSRVVAVLAACARRTIATQHEERNEQQEQQQPTTRGIGDPWQAA